jgi:hypothetical protein
MRFKKIGKKEYFQNGEDDKKLDQQQDKKLSGSC